MFELKVLGAADETERLPRLFAGVIEVHLVLRLLIQLCHTQLDDTAYLDIPLQHHCTHRNTLQHTATHCNTPQHTATHRNT